MPITWPTTVTASKLVHGWSADPTEFIGATILPLNTTDYQNTSVIKYDRTAPITGLTGAYGRMADPKLVKHTGFTAFKQDTAYWKEQYRLDEFDFLENRGLGPAEYQRLGMERFAMMARQADVRLETRLEQLRWAATRNEFAAGVSIDGVQVKVDYGIAAATTANPLWTSPTTAKPLTDILNVVLSYKGTGAKYVDIFMNDVTAALLLDNDQIKDKIIRSDFVGDLNIGQVGELIKKLTIGQGALVGCPMIRNIVVYASVYVDDAGANQPFIPNYKVQFIGGRVTPMPNVKPIQTELLGEFASTPAVIDGWENTRPGKFMIVEDYSRTGKPHLLMTPGIYGMVAIYHPEWLKTLTVG